MGCQEGNVGHRVSGGDCRVSGDGCGVPDGAAECHERVWGYMKGLLWCLDGLRGVRRGGGLVCARRGCRVSGVGCGVSDRVCEVSEGGVGVRRGL